MYFAKYFKPIMRYLVGLNKPEIIAPAIIQPLIILFSAYVIPNSILLISATLAIALITSMYLAKNELRSHFLYYWTVLSMSYTIIVFEFVIVPLAEISPNENYFLILFTVLTLFFLYLTTISSSISSSSDKEENNAYGESLLNGNSSISICPACRIKMDPRNYHCNICQECIPKYDHHSYWLNCCIGDSNFHYYVAGVFFGVFALAYASLLILTTICSPDFFWGILLPEDCTDVCSNIETCTCLICGIYCLELAVILFWKVIYHSWLISRGLSMFEWREQFRYNLSKIRPYSNGFIQNWIQFFKKFKKINFKF